LTSSLPIFPLSGSRSRRVNSPMERSMQQPLSES
jgi:hypothetical protein